MNSKLIAILGTWLFCDGIFSLHCYWGKEGFKEHYIRIIRIIIGLIFMIWG